MERTTHFLYQCFKCAALWVLVCLFQNSYAQTGYWQQQVNYDIQVQLQDKNSTLDGLEKIVYFNNSPDTLHYIWFHVWMNAYKNDKTAFSEQKLMNGSTDFYFSEDDKRGSIGKMSFKVNDEKVIAETHPKYIDIIKVNLKHPLAPHTSIEITTPFHVKLPYNFSRGGHIGNDYQITQWYPKPAVYDARGWHTMPYLDQGEFFSEFGDYHVEITVPEKYVVAASGVLANAAALAANKVVKSSTEKTVVPKSVPAPPKALVGRRGKKLVTAKPIIEQVAAAEPNKTLIYNINQVHDFAWFASPDFTVDHDTLQLKTKTVDVYTYYNAKESNGWNRSVAYAKDGIRKYSEWLGDYPYSTASVVCGAANVPSGGMEYPSITLITTEGGGKSLDEVIAHELGHNWFYGALASNEREHAWMDEGMNTFYQKRYISDKYTKLMSNIPGVIKSRIPEDEEQLTFETVAAMKKDQPIETVSDSLSDLNYGLIVYEKAALWMKHLEQNIGRNKFDSAMKVYYSQWQNKHPYPEDFKRSFETASGSSIDSLYHQLFVQGSLEPVVTKKKTKIVGLFSLGNTAKNNYISILPVAGYNYYDNIMPGIGIHNYQLPLNKLQYFGAVVYGTSSKQFHTVARASYNIYQPFNNYQYAISYADYNMDKFRTASGSNIFLKVTKIVPSFHWTIFTKDACSTERFNVLLRSFFINEEHLDFSHHDTVGKYSESYNVNQLKLTWSNYRKLYPFDLNLQIDQGDGFVRAGLTGNYYFNYAKEKEGIQARFFAGKFFYTVNKTFVTQFQRERYHLNLSGANGNEDYTYSDYFIARNKFEGWQSQQIMQRDGFFKMRTDLYSSKVGKTDDWLIAMNFEGKVPDNINPLKLLPFRIPLHFFVDVGTYADVWKDNSGSTERFLYDAGLYLPIFNGLAKVYMPIFYSNVFSEYVNSFIPDKTNHSIFGTMSIFGNQISTIIGDKFLQTVSFSLNLDLFKPQKLIGQVPL